MTEQAKADVKIDSAREQIERARVDQISRDAAARYRKLTEELHKLRAVQVANEKIELSYASELDDHWRDMTEADQKATEAWIAQIPTPQKWTREKGREWETVEDAAKRKAAESEKELEDELAKADLAKTAPVKPAKATPKK